MSTCNLKWTSTKTIGTNQLDKNIAGALNFPYLCHLDKSEWLLVCDSGNKRMFMFDEAGHQFGLHFKAEVEPHLSVLDASQKLLVFQKGMKLL